MLDVFLYAFSFISSLLLSKLFLSGKAEAHQLVARYEGSAMALLKEEDGHQRDGFRHFFMRLAE